MLIDQPTWRCAKIHQSLNHVMERDCRHQEDWQGATGVHEIIHESSIANKESVLTPSLNSRFCYSKKESALTLLTFRHRRSNRRLFLFTGSMDARPKFLNYSIAMCFLDVATFCAIGSSSMISITSEIVFITWIDHTWLDAKIMRIAIAFSIVRSRYFYHFYHLLSGSGLLGQGSFDTCNVDLISGSSHLLLCIHIRDYVANGYKIFSSIFIPLGHEPGLGARESHTLMYRVREKKKREQVFHENHVMFHRRTE